jgi:hypothetical protein
MKKLLFLSLVLVIGFMMFTGQSSNVPQKWSEPLRTFVYDPQQTNSAPIPQVKDNYWHPNSEVRVVRTPTEILLVNPSVRVCPRTNSWQSEVTIEPNPVNPNILFGSSNAFSNLGSLWISEGVYVTTNAGATWYGNDTLNGAPATNHGGDPAPTIDKNGNLIISHLGYTTAGMFGNYSTNNGLTWSANYTIQSGSVDKNLSGTDDVPASPFYGRSYTVWTQWGGTYPPQISYTSNGGVSWSTPTTIITPLSGYIARGEDVEVGPGGVVYAVWLNNIGNGAEAYLAFAKSTDGGVTFTGNQQAAPVNGLLCFGNCFMPYNIRMNSFARIAVDKTGGARNGWIYIATSGKNIAPLGSDPDVELFISSNGGTSWTAKRVNTDPINNGKNQFYNAVCVDGTGAVNVIYYSNAYTSVADSCEVIVARSNDGGNTFTEVVASDHRFKPKPVTLSGIAGGYAGDYIGIAAAGSKIYPFWMDDITGIYQAWTSSIDLGPAISHTPLPNTENIAGPYVVNCTITPAGSPIVPANTKLLWSRNNVNITDSLLMTNSSGNNWTANIPGNNTNATYRYYIKTADQLGRVATAPSGAPGTLYSFLAQTDVTPPVITHTPLTDQPKATWPATVTCTVVDNTPQDFGLIDSAWVRWRIGAAGVTRHFKLTNTSGSTFSAAFNSVQADVNPGDVIYYRIIAQEGTTQHLKDSTAQLNFTITSIVNACVGTGTTAVGYPYYTFYMDSRCDMLYTAAEMTAAGLAPGNITKIGFNVQSVGSPAMSGFNIKVQNTALTTISGFTSSGWTTCYTGTYTPPGTGIQYVTLTTPFAWNGTSNLLIEICFNNSAWSSNSTVLGSAVTGRCWHEYQDLSAADGCVALVAGTTQATRPNVCMEINTLVGHNQQNTELPKVFSLSQNYPNPFNPSTTIKYEVPKQSLVKLIVYDVLGREVATLVNTVKSAGRYEANFDASVLSSGVYFYRMESGEFIDVKKMLLIK